MTINASFVSKRMMQLKFWQLRFLSSNNSDRPLGIVMMITVPFSTTRALVAGMLLPRCTVADHRKWLQFSCRRRPPLMTMTLTGPIFLRRYTVTLPKVWRTMHCNLRVVNHLSCGFNFNFSWKVASKDSTSGMPSTYWSNCRDVTCHGMTSDVRSISSQNIRVSS